MNLEERLKQLKRITPKTDYSDRSRSFILSTSQEVVRPRLTVWQFVVQNIQFGSAIALTGLLLLLGFGGFSAWKFISPFGLSSLDPANLRAEAEAVNDIGVALNSIQYIPAAAPSPALPQARSVNPAPKPSPATPTAATLATPPSATSTEAGVEGTEEGASSTSPDFSTTTVDQALDFLLEQ